MKPKLILIELWGLGDLIIASPFLWAATKKFEVTLLAKPHAEEMRPHFWPEVNVIPFVAPWTAFRKKYQVWRWPWAAGSALRNQLAEERFAVAISGRRDPRDHVLMFSIGATERVGFPRLGSERFLTRCLRRPDPVAHRYEHWRIAGKELGLELPAESPLGPCRAATGRRILLHTGAGQPIRTWPLERYANVCRRLRSEGWEVRVACDVGQLEWWQQHGEAAAVAPRSVAELVHLIQTVDCFVGNDSGPGHVAAACGLPTFSIFGPQLPEWFLPMSAKAEFVEGKPCPYRPCSDYCRFPVAHCLERITEAEVWGRLSEFLATRVEGRAAQAEKV
jgi:ADP-heptose:LPS heptosyltransferase